jgi:hypothetical protein
MDYWKQLLKKYYPNETFYAQTGYAIGCPLITIDALRKIGRDLTREKFIETLESYDKFTTKNYPMAQPISFSKTNHVGMQKFSISTMATGEPKIIYNWKQYEEVIKGK